MNNYFINQIVAIDIFLVSTIAVLSFIVIVYVLLIESSARKRNKGLINIKKNVYEMVLSGAKLSANTCAPFAEASTPQQFLDIAMNRDSVFFNEREQEAFKTCFKASDNMKRIEDAALKARNKWRRIEAILSLSYLDSKNAPNILNRSLSSKDADIRYFSVMALGQMKNSQSSRILVDMIKNGGFSRRKLVSILESFPPDTTSEHAIPLLKNTDTDVRFWTLKLLSQLGPGKHLNEITDLTKDPSEEIRSAACECLGNYGNKAASNTLTDALQDESWLVRSAGVKALSELLGDGCISKIMGLLGDNSLSVLSAVKDALVAHIDAAMPYIEKVYSDGDRMAKMICVEAVEEAGKGKAK